MYLDSLTRAGIENTVEALSPSDRNLLMVHRGMLTWEDLTVATSEAQTQADDWFPGMHGPVRRMATTPPYIRDTESDTEAWYAMRFQFVDELTENVDYVAGGPPEEGGPGILAEVSVYEPLAREFGISVGDTVTGLRIDREGETLTVRVSGLFQTDTLGGPFWMAYGRSMVTPEPIDGAVNNQQIGAPAGMFLNEEGLRALMGRGLQDPLLTRWITPLDRDALMEMGHEEIVEQVRGIEGRLRENVPGSQFLSPLDAQFEDLGRRLVFARIPMFLIAALLLAIVIYYVLMSASTLASRRADEISMLRSRGISLAQMGWMYALEAMFLVGAPVVLGPLLALLIVSQAGRLPLYDSVTGGEPMPVSLGWESFALALLAGLVTLAVMVAPALVSGYGRVATRQQERARPEGKPFFQRYFLDAAVLAVGGFFVWELNSRGGAVISSGESGQLEMDPAILATPALFLLGISLLFLRAFPPIARLLAWMARRAGPAWATLA
ncbi:MAG: ABC transporter permease, partial [Chloroflexota bacterium]